MHQSGSQKMWVQFPALPLTSRVTSGKPLDVDFQKTSGAKFSYWSLVFKGAQYLVISMMLIMARISSKLSKKCAELFWKSGS